MLSRSHGRTAAVSVASVGYAAKLSAFHYNQRGFSQKSMRENKCTGNRNCTRHDKHTLYIAEHDEPGWKQRLNKMR